MKKTLLPSSKQFFRNILNALLVGGFLIVSINARATHISGGEITYRCIGNNKYIVTLTLFRDCSGVSMSASESVSVESDCGTQTSPLPLINPGGTEISQICALQMQQTTCTPGGTLQGMQKYIYEDTVNILPCTNWVISWNSCCRNTTVSFPSQPGSYVEATLNNVIDSCNISPSFLAAPIPNVCLNKPTIYNLSASNPDGDSLKFSFISAREADFNGDPLDLTYSFPYSATNPIDGITIDSVTGTMTFTPTTLGNFIVVVQISQYDDSTGVLIGTVMRDIQISVVNCVNNTAPLNTSGVITNLSGTAIQISDYSLELCSGGNFSFDLSVVDTNAADTVFLTSDVTEILPGATFTADTGNPATATITWTDTGAFSGTKYFTVTAKDNVCPVPGMRIYVYSVTVIQATFGVPTPAVICGTQSTQLSANGGNVFNWLVISGDSIDVGTNFSCNPCANPVATPDTTTTYVVTSNLGSGCTNVDTLTVAVVPDFTYTTSQSDSVVCLFEDVQFNVTPSAGTFTYQWFPANIFDNPTASGPTAIFSNSGNNTVYFTITSAGGCSKTDSMSISVGTAASPLASISGDPSICSGDSTQLFVVISNFDTASTYSYSWTPSTGLSNDSISNPWANPPADTMYTVVVVNNFGGCSDTVGVNINIASDFTYTKTQSDSGICLFDDVQFNVIPDSGTYTYQWYPGSIFNDSTIANPTATFNYSGTKTVYFKVSNSSGCDKTDSMIVTVSTNAKPVTEILADTTVCSGGSVQMEAVITNAIPATCGLSQNGCSGNPSQITVGTGTSVLGNTSYPAPYGNWYMGVKHQLLFTAAELNTLGFLGGQITSLALNVQSISGTTLYKNFEIKLGCTNLTALSTWQTGLVTVFPAQNITIATGWNTHTFATGFDWDGTSNVIVDICFNNQPDPYTTNSPTYYTPTTFNSVLYYNADVNPTVCSSPQFTNISVNRPNVRFSVCTGGGGENLSYVWSPASGLDSSSISNPVATVSGDMTYTVIVTDTVGGCADTVSVNLYAVPDFTYTKSQSDSSVCLLEDVQFDVTPSAGTYIYEWTPSVIFNNDTLANPIATFDSSGVNTVYFTVSNIEGCDKSDSMSVSVGTSEVPISFIFADTTICTGDSTQLNVFISNADSSSTYSYLWSASEGLSDSTSANPWANPSSDTSYTVVVTDNFGGCSDTVSVNLYFAPDFTYTKSQSDSAICLFDNVQFNITPSAGTYSYLWSPGTIFNDSTIANPVATFNSSGLQAVFFTVSNSSGCDKTDTMIVLVSTSAKPVTAILADTTVCAGGNVQLNAIITNSAPSSCGLSANGCQGSPSQITVGTGTSVLGNTSYPAPYGNWYMGVKHQLLFTAAELNALNFQGGQITSLALNVESISGTTLYKNFEIKMGCTNLTSLSTWQTGLVTVFPAQNITITTGWNTHAFATGFDWDGTSNVIVDICFNNQPDPWTNNSPTYYTPTTFNSVIYYNADNTPTVCSSPGFVNTSTNRPNVMFSVCSGGGGENLSYSWSPTSGLNDSSISNPVATISSNTTYTVIVTDTIGGCSDSVSINLTAVPNFTYTSTQSDTGVCQGNTVQFSVTPSPGTYTYLWTPSSTFNNDTVSNPSAVFDSSGMQTVYFTISSPGGCDKTDSMKVNVGPPAPNIFIATDTVVCMGDSAQLNALIAFPCGISTFACTGTPSQITVGTGTNLLDDTSYPAPYGNYFYGAKHQLLFTRAELNALGFQGGQISALAMNIPDIGNGATNYENFEIKMGCTALNSLSAWQTGLSVVFPAQTITIINGWNFHNFSNTFNWDGISNIIIEICFNNFGSSTNAPTYYTTTSFNSVLFYEGNNFTVCSAPGSPTFSNYRPNVLFSVCSGASGYSYLWSGNPVSNDTIADPFTEPLTADASYTVTVTDANGCTGTDNISILASPPPFLNLGPDAAFCDSTILSASGFSSYLWSTGDTTANIAVTAAGTYSVTVYDANGCDNADDIVLTIDTTFVAQITNAPDTACTTDTILLNATPSGGTWSGPGTSVNGVFIADSAGTGSHEIIYSVTSNGCTAKDTVIIIVDSCAVGINEFQEGFGFQVYPNPNNGKFSIYLNTQYSILNTQIKIYNVLGALVYTSAVKNNFSEIDLKKYGSGIYSIQIMNEKGILTKKIVVE